MTDILQLYYITVNLGPYRPGSFVLNNFLINSYNKLLHISGRISVGVTVFETLRLSPCVQPCRFACVSDKNGDTDRLGGTTDGHPPVRTATYHTSGICYRCTTELRRY